MAWRSPGFDSPQVHGGLAEWFIALVSKTSFREIGAQVQILHPPQVCLHFVQTPQSEHGVKETHTFRVRESLGSIPSAPT